MPNLTSLLVGAHFRPPAKLVLAHLPAGASLVLDPEPSNPYDSNAVRVLVSPTALPESEWPALEAELPEFGSDLDSLLAHGTLDSDEIDEPMIWLGYIAATGGKPLANARPGLVGNSEVLAQLAACPTATAILRFGPGGEPEVEISDAN